MMQHLLLKAHRRPHTFAHSTLFMHVCVCTHAINSCSILLTDLFVSSESEAHACSRVRCDGETSESRLHMKLDGQTSTKI